jgi:hypothetical protein
MRKGRNIRKSKAKHRLLKPQERASQNSLSFYHEVGFFNEMKGRRVSFGYY